MSDPVAPGPERPDESNPSEARPGWFPALPVREWLTYGALAAALAVINIYTTLLTGWGDGGSIIAVIAAVMVLSALGRRVHIQSLNLGQTMASAGGTVGFAVAAYAAVKLVDPQYEANPVLLTLMFIAMSLVGVVIGTTVRAQMIRYYFPSGTACAVIQRVVTDRSGSAESRRPMRLLAWFGAVAAAWAVPVTVALEKGGHALLSRIPLGSIRGQALGIALNPVFFGIGVVVGPRIGGGILLGALAGPFVLLPALEASGPDAAQQLGNWTTWTAIAALTLPTFAALAFAYVFRTPPIVPPGFTPGRASYAQPPSRNPIYAVIAVIGLVATGVTAQALFGLSWFGTLVAVGLCFPLAIMNGRVTGDTDINPVLLVVIIVLVVFVLAVSSAAPVLLGMVLIVSVLAGVAVDIMQDYRTGYLVDANPTHQTSVQLVGVVIGALVAVPFILLLDAKYGFGPDAAFAAPGPRIYAELVTASVGAADLPRGLVIAIIAISVVGSGYAFLTVWPKTARWMPSIFGAGIGLLIGIEASAAIFCGGVVKWVVSQVYVSGARAKAAGRASAREASEAAGRAAHRADEDMMIAGAALFASGAIMAVLLIVLANVTGWFHIAG